MSKKPKSVKPGWVRRIIKPIHPSQPEKAEIEVLDADDLYKEIRIENTLEDEHDNPVKLKEHAEVEADKSATTPKSDAKST